MPMPKFRNFSIRFLIYQWPPVLGVPPPPSNEFLVTSFSAASKDCMRQSECRRREALAESPSLLGASSVRRPLDYVEMRLSTTYTRTRTVRVEVNLLWRPERAITRCSRDRRSADETRL